MLEKTIKQIRAALGPDSTGQCYVASEALYHMAAKAQGYRPAVMRLKSPGLTHWYLIHDSGSKVIDITADQFGGDTPDYMKGRRCGFLTKQPSKRARALIAAVHKANKTTDRTTPKTLENSNPQTQGTPQENNQTSIVACNKCLCRATYLDVGNPCVVECCDGEYQYVGRLRPAFMQLHGISAIKPAREVVAAALSNLAADCHVEPYRGMQHCTDAALRDVSDVPGPESKKQ